jgi:hypothetical protein
MVRRVIEGVTKIGDAFDVLVQRIQATLLTLSFSSDSMVQAMMDMLDAFISHTYNYPHPNNYPVNSTANVPVSWDRAMAASTRAGAPYYSNHSFSAANVTIINQGPQVNVNANYASPEASNKIKNDIQMVLELM